MLCKDMVMDAEEFIDSNDTVNELLHTLSAMNCTHTVTVSKCVLLRKFEVCKTLNYVV